jgi:hypothetical protein
MPGVTIAIIGGGHDGVTIQRSQIGPGSARVQGEAVGSIFGLTIDGLGEVSIFVPEEYLEDARSILSAGEHGDLLLGESDRVDETNSH